MELVTLISEQNPQWSDPDYLPKETSWYHRAVWKELSSWQDKRFILSLTGLRRCGKSTLLKQLLGKLIKEKKSGRCLYFSFERVLRKHEPEFLKQVIDCYFTHILKEKIYRLNKKVYLFLDEVQKIPHWEEIVKYFYDQNENLKFIISGSNSLFIRKKSAESLGGRIISLKIHPLSFSEYLTMTDYREPVKPHDQLWINSNIGLINGHFERYLSFGQFPEIIGENLTDLQAQTYLEEIAEKVTQEDLPKVFPVKHPEILALFIKQITACPGQRIEYSSIGKEVGLDQRTVAKYFDYLEKGFMLTLCRSFGKKPLKALRVVKKAYLSSTNFCHPANLGIMAENYVFNFWQSKSMEVYFQKDKEVDFVAVDKNGEIYLSEVKYQRRIEGKDIKNLKSFMKTRKVKKAFLLTKEDFREGAIISLPASLLEFYF